jgi:hypothetical protein
MSEQLLDDVLRHAGVDQSGPESVAELVAAHPDRLARPIAQVDDGLPVGELAGEAGMRVGL